MAIYNAGTRLAQVGANVGARIVENERNRPQVQAASAEAKLRRNRADAANTPENIQIELEAVKAAQQSIAAKQAKDASYDAFRRYTKDYNPRHLNTLMKSEPLVRSAFGDPVSFERVDPNTDKQLLAKHNLTTTPVAQEDLEALKETNPQAYQEKMQAIKDGTAPQEFDPRVHLKVIDGDGDTRIQDIRMDMAGSGFFNHLRDEELDRLIKESKLFGKGKSYAPGSLQKDATYLAGQGIEGGNETEIANNLYLDRIGGNTVAQQRLADEAITGLFDTFGGDEEYFNADLTKQSNRVRAERYIRRLESYGGVKMSAKDRADLKDLNTLAVTGNIVAEKLTPEITGAFDNLYRGVKNYVSDEVSDEDELLGRSAYAAFRNTVRHALFGSALTDGEIQAFNEAFGTLRQKYPAVANQFKTALVQTKSKLETIYQLNNPILAKYYMGKTGEDIAIAIREIDNRLELFGKTGSVESKKTPREDPNIAPNVTQSLDDIFYPQAGGE